MREGRGKVREGRGTGSEGWRIKSKVTGYNPLH